MRFKSETAVGAFFLLSIAVFFILVFYLKIFRIENNQYVDYKIYLKDTCGISKKSDVKIAGVKVGWVEEINLNNETASLPAVQVLIKILKECKLKSDSQAAVRQDGMLGNKFLEIIPGKTENYIGSGQALTTPSQESPSLDEIFISLQKVANNLESITESLKASIGFENNGSKKLNDIIENFNQATITISNASTKITEIISNSEHSIKNTIESAQESINQIQDSATKINSGKGLLGKLINEDGPYNDILSASRSIRSYFDKFNKIAVLADTHVESMYGLAEKFDFRDSKGYFNLRIYPLEDYFFILGMTGSQRGYISRKEFTTRYFDENNRELLPSIVNADNRNILLIAREETIKENRDSWRINAQFCRIFNRMAIRLGLFEGFAGLALDVDIPTTNELFRWISTLEAYDFRGRNRFFEDARPHLKWLNRIFFSRNLYFVFGADDFISKYNKNMYVGAGIRFSDDDLKYMIPFIGFAAD